MSHPEIIIVPVVFGTFAYIIKLVLDSRIRGKLIATNSSSELIQSMLLSEERRRRHSSLQWGIVLSFLGIGFAMIEAFDWTDKMPGTLALLLVATGLGNLVFYFFTRNQDLPRSVER